jgi:serine/threonine protein phosphatase 1
MEKIFAVGDIHGCLEKLKELISLIELDEEKDTLVLIGDYIDRGPDAKGVVDYILDLKRSIEKVICLKGNHEEMLLNYVCHGRNREFFLLNGGRATINSYGQKDTEDGMEIDIPDDHMEFFKSLLPYYETEMNIFVHAGLKPGVPLEEQKREDLIWIRHEFIGSDYDFGKVVVFGHTPLMEPLIESNKIGIDTGAVYGRCLTCVELPQKKIYQV